MDKTLLVAGLFVALALAPAASAGPPVPVSVQKQDDGSVCVTVSLQVPQCTPPLSAAVGPVGVCVPDPFFGGCLFTLYTTPDGVCFYPTTAPTFCVEPL